MYVKYLSSHSTETVSKVSCKGNAKFLFPEYEIDMEPEELDEVREKTEEEVMQEYEALLRSGRVTRDLDDGKKLYYVQFKDCLFMLSLKLQTFSLFKVTMMQLL